MTWVYIGVGSNSEHQKNLRYGVERLREKLRLLHCSPVYKSMAVENVDAEPYANAVLIVETNLDAAALKALLVEIENSTGRVRRDTDGSKSKQVTLDFDILLFGDQPMRYEFDGKEYRLPHPDLERYAHVIVPLADIAPTFVHPTTGETIETLLEGVAKDDLERLDFDLN